MRSSAHVPLQLGKQLSTACSAVSDSGFHLRMLRGACDLIRGKRNHSPRSRMYWSSKYSHMLCTWLIRIHKCVSVPCSSSLWRLSFLACPATLPLYHQISYGNWTSFGQSSDKGMDTWPKPGPTFAYLGLFWFWWGHSPIPLCWRGWELLQATFPYQVIIFILRQWSQNPERQRPLPALPCRSWGCSCESIKISPAFGQKESCLIHGA